MTRQSVMNPTAVINWSREVRRMSWIWSGKRGRDYVLWETFLQLFATSKKFDGTATVSHRTLTQMSNINSNEGLVVSINRLVEVGLIEIVDRGSSDIHSTEARGLGRLRQRGRAATYRLRQPVSPVHVSYEEMTEVDRHATVIPCIYHEVIVNAHGRHPLPNEDHFADERTTLLRGLPNPDLVKMDAVADEWHLLRVIHLTDGETNPEITTRGLHNLLGLALSSCSEMLSRWKKKGLVINGILNVMDTVLAPKESWRRLMARLSREDDQRSEALAGRWVPSRIRTLQRRMLTYKGRFASVDPEIVSSVTAAQEEKARQGFAPWLDPGELLRAVYDGMGVR